jgi:segregation and condensation protein B
VEPAEEPAEEPEDAPSDEPDKSAPDSRRDLKSPDRSLSCRPAMDLSEIVEALITASEDPLSAGRIVELIHSRAEELAQDAREAEAAALKAAKQREKNGDKPAPAPAPDPTEGEFSIDELLAIDTTAVESAIAALNEHYESTDRAFRLLHRASGWKLYTEPAYADFVGQLYPGRRTERLSGPAMETLAIVAYRQPITKAAIEAVRGVGCDAMLQRLLDRELVRIAGRAELPGRPLLYDTTDFFFEHFGVRSVDELPNSAELRKTRLPEPESETPEPPAPPAEERQLTLGETSEKSDKPDESAPSEIPASENPASEPTPSETPAPAP